MNLQSTFIELCHKDYKPSRSFHVTQPLSSFYLKKKERKKVIYKTRQHCDRLFLKISFDLLKLDMWVLHKAHPCGCLNLTQLYRKGKIHYVGEVIVLTCLQL